MSKVDEVAELKQVLADLLEVATYDFENCDFGPAYGLMRDREKKVVAKARMLTKGVKPSPRF